MATLNKRSKPAAFPVTTSPHDLQALDLNCPIYKQWNALWGIFPESVSTHRISLRNLHVTDDKGYPSFSSCYDNRIYCTVYRETWNLVTAWLDSCRVVVHCLACVHLLWLISKWGSGCHLSIKKYSRLTIFCKYNRKIYRYQFFSPFVAEEPETIP